MAHFAKVVNGRVTDIIVAEPEFFETFVDNSPGEWIQTSYNTFGGVHQLGGTPLRKNYAAIGGIYDEERDAFYSPQPFPSWTLNEETCLWEAPVPKPDTNVPCVWNEDTQSWSEIN